MFFDDIHTTYLVDPIPGQCSGGSYRDDFGGTSGATPMVCGHFGIFFQMWATPGPNPALNVFGYPLTAPGGSVFENRPRSSTARAMMINSSRQYEFAGDIDRSKAGWGWPDLSKAYDLRERFPVIIDETVALEEFETYSTMVTVEPGVPALRATMVFTDPAGNPGSPVSRINDLTLRAVSPGGVKYIGNHGLMQGPWSMPNGPENDVDTVENIFIQNPEPGNWLITVRAEEIIEDARPNETPGILDADFALVVSLDHSDCNGNGLADYQDIAAGTSPDTDFNGVPDECETVYVDASATGLNNGSSWANAHTELRSALASLETVDPCAFRASKVWIAQGTYTPSGTGDRDESFVIPDGMTIFGGFPPGGSEFADRNHALYATILSGDLNDDDQPGFINIGDNSRHVVQSAPLAASIGLNGVIITGGNADTAPARGGGIYNTTAALRMVNCSIAANRASDRGGGVYSDGDVILANVTFAGNHADSHGGGMLCFGGSKLLTNCAFTGNTTNANGGAFYTGAAASLVNCTLSGNSAVGNGGAILHQDGASDLANCILWNNSDSGGQDESAQIHVLTGVVTVDYSDLHGCWTGPGGNNLCVDPQFLDANGADDLLGTIDDNLHLATLSPCADAADNTIVPTDTFDLDQDGDFIEMTPRDPSLSFRFSNNPSVPDTGNGTPPIADMGSYEYQGTSVDCVLADANVCVCNLSIDGVCVNTPAEYGNVNCSANPTPNLDDILCTLAAFGNFASCPNSDISPPCTGNNLINVDDILAMLSAFSGIDPCGCSS